MEKRKKVVFSIIAIILFAAGCYYYVVYRSETPEGSGIQGSAKSLQVVFSQEDIEAAANKPADASAPAPQFSEEQLSAAVQEKADPNEPQMLLFEKP